MKKFSILILALLFSFYGIANAQTATNVPSNAPDKKAPAKVRLEKVNNLSQYVIFFGSWNHQVSTKPGFYINDTHASSQQFNTCWLAFSGTTIRAFGAKSPNHGLSDIYIDGKLAQTIDSYSPTHKPDELLFEQTNLPSGEHVMTLVVRKERNKDAGGCVTELDYFECERPLDYRVRMKTKMNREYHVIFADRKPQPDISKWQPVQDVVHAPEGGVSLKPGVLDDVFKRNIDYLNYSFSFPSYTDRKGWSAWLPAANDGRLLAGAANSLRWGEREDVRKIVTTILDKIKKQMRSDGYYNYYPEAESFECVYDANSERKNYDRGFWTKGLLYAGRAGFPEAYPLVRRFYDWFNASPYPRDILKGNNAENALSLWPLVYKSPIGKPEDLINAIRYCDQDYWIYELVKRDPFAFSDYPGNKPMHYDLLGLVGFLDQYKATGDKKKYLSAVIGGWEVYKQYYMHVGGTAAICENAYYPPGSQYLNTAMHTGETCGSIFWIELCAELMRLFPTEEKYSAEVEKQLYNVVMAAQNEKGLIRYHNHLEGTKDRATCENSCCETSTAGFIGNLPALIYSTADDGLYVHLFAASTINWKVNGKNVVVETETKFPYASGVLMTVKEAGDVPMKIRIRVPSWAAGKIPVKVNGEQFTVGTPGSYVTLDRKWKSKDKIEFELPAGFRTEQYTGLSQAEGNLDRYALLWGPILMALEAPVNNMPRNITNEVPETSHFSPQDAPMNGIPRITASADQLPKMLTPVAGQPLHYSVKGQPGVQYLPYWQVRDQTFTCFPVFQP